MKFVQLILRKIIKTVATRCQILRLKCTKFDFGWGSAPDPAGGAYSVPPDPVAGFEGATSKGGEGKGKGMRGEGTKEKGEEGREGEGKEEQGGERGGRRRKGKGGLSDNVAEEAFCLKSAPGVFLFSIKNLSSPSFSATPRILKLERFDVFMSATLSLRSAHVQKLLFVSSGHENET